MKRKIEEFLEEDEGAVTVDWVVMTAAVVGIGTAAVSTVQDGIEALASDISSAISTKTVNNGDGSSGSGL